MASNTTIHRPGRVARVIHHLLPSSWGVALFLFTEVGLTVLGTPPWLHLLAGVALHMAAWRWHGRR